MRVIYAGGYEFREVRKGWWHAYLDGFLAGREGEPRGLQWLAQRLLGRNLTDDELRGLGDEGPGG